MVNLNEATSQFDYTEAHRQAVSNLIYHANILTPAEIWGVKWQYNRTFHGALLGGFYAAFFEAANRADAQNFRRLSMGFPDEIDGMRAWRHGDLAEKVRRFLDDFIDRRRAEFEKEVSQR